MRFGGTKLAANLHGLSFASVAIDLPQLGSCQVDEKQNTKSERERVTQLKTDTKRSEIKESGRTTIGQ